MRSLAARVLIGVAAVTGFALSWGLFNWIGRSSEHCDFPAQCLDTWLPRAFMLTLYLWVAAISLAGAGIAAAVVAGWHRRDLSFLGAAWLSLVLAVGITPQDGDGEPMTHRQLRDNTFFAADFPWYWVLATVALTASLVLATQALRPRPH